MVEMDKNTPNKQGFHHLNQKQLGSLSELQYFLEELGSWRREREESQKQLDSLIDSYSSSIKRGIDNLIVQVGDLQAKNNLITEENSKLLVIINKANAEIEHPNDKIVPDPNENSSKEAGEENGGETPSTIKEKFEDDHHSMFQEDSKSELIPWINNLTYADVTITRHETELEQVPKDQPDIKDNEQKETLRGLFHFE